MLLGQVRLDKPEKIEVDKEQHIITKTVKLDGLDVLRLQWSSEVEVKFEDCVTLV